MNKVGILVALGLTTFSVLCRLCHAAVPASLNYNDIFQLEYAASPQVTPDYKTVIYERRSMDIMSDSTRVNLWEIDLATQQQRPLLSDGHSYSSPVISKDGKRLAYLSAKEGSTQLYVRWLDTGATVKVTNLQTPPGNISWSPDGNWLAMTQFVASKPTVLFTDMPTKPKGAKWAETAKAIDKTNYRSDGRGYNQPGFTHLFIIPSEGGSPRQLTSGDYNHGGQFSWSQDSKSIYFAANREQNWQLKPLVSDIYQIQLDSSELTKITDHKGAASQPLLSTSGKRLAYNWIDDNNMAFQVSQVVIMDLDGSNRKVITSSLDRTITDKQWSSNDRSMLVSYLDHGQHKLAQIDESGKTVSLDITMGGQSLGRPYTSGEFVYAGSNKGNLQIVFTPNTPQRPADLALYQRKQINPLTSLNEDVLAYKSLAETQAITIQSSVDQRDIDAWIALPPNFDPAQTYPMILEIHGGPHAAYGEAFSAEIQLMAAKGYVVVWSNPRGSSSYGTEFGNLIHHNYPSNDYHDLMDVVDAVIAKGYIDTNNLFITGGSGGGVLTAWSIGKTDRFAAAVVAKPVINWLSFALTADAYPYFTQYWMEDMPWNIADKLWQRSPLSLVGKVNTPTMLLTGEMDYRTPMSETEQYYQALRLRNIDSAMVRIPGASHGIASKPSRLIQKVGNILAWFEKYKSTSKQ